MYRSLELTDEITKQTLRKYGFRFNGMNYEFFKKLGNNISITFIANVADNNDDNSFINYKVTDMNTDNPYAPYYTDKYSHDNKVTNKIEKRINTEIEKMINVGLIK